MPEADVRGRRLSSQFAPLHTIALPGAAGPAPALKRVVEREGLSAVVLARISHTFCDTEAIRSDKVSRCKSLTAAGQADPFRQSVFQPSAGRLMDIGLPPQSASVFRAKCSPPSSV